MAITLSVSTGGSGPLVQAVVKPLDRANMPVRASIVKVSESGVGRKVLTGARLRTQHLIAPDSTSARVYSAGAKDVNGVWSEGSTDVSLTAANFSASTTEGSIGSGVATDLEVEEPQLAFPELNIGTGSMGVRRTEMTDSFYDEVRRQQFERTRIGFDIILTDILHADAMLVHKFYRTCLGALKAFVFDYTDEATGLETRYVVRFREKRLSSTTRSPGYSSMAFSLIEVVDAAQGGDV